MSVSYRIISPYKEEIIFLAVFKTKTCKNRGGGGYNGLSPIFRELK